MPKAKFKAFAKVQKLISPHDTRLFFLALFLISLCLSRKAAKDAQEKKKQLALKEKAPIEKFIIYLEKK